MTIPAFDERLYTEIEKELNEDPDAMDREKLATIERVVKIEPIENRDFIESVSFLGYRGVCQKGIHKVSDLALVVKPETIVPEISMFEFMRSTKFRVKAKSFNIPEIGKIYSQIIVIPLSELMSYEDIFIEEGFDVTSILKIRKYIPKLPQFSVSSFGVMKPKATFPTNLLSITDEENGQNSIQLIEDMQGLPYSISLKAEGSSATFYTDPIDKTFNVCSRKMNLKAEDNNSFWYVARKYGIESILIENPQYAIQGEMCGMMPDSSHKVQSNVMGLEDLELFVFNIINLETRRRLDIKYQIDFCKKYGLTHVPIYELGESFDYSLDNLLKIAESLTYSFGRKIPVEGIVVRPQQDTYSYKLHGTLSYKIKNPAYDFPKLCQSHPSIKS